MDTSTIVITIMRILLYLFTIYSLISIAIIHYKNSDKILLAVHVSIALVLGINLMALIFKLMGNNQPKIFFDFIMTPVLTLLSTSVWLNVFRRERKNTSKNIKKIEESKMFDSCKDLKLEA